MRIWENLELAKCVVKIIIKKRHKAAMDNEVIDYLILSIEILYSRLGIK